MFGLFYYCFLIDIGSGFYLFKLLCLLVCVWWILNLNKEWCNEILVNKEIVFYNKKDIGWLGMCVVL